MKEHHLRRLAVFTLDDELRLSHRRRRLLSLPPIRPFKRNAPSSKLLRLNPKGYQSSPRQKKKTSSVCFMKLNYSVLNADLTSSMRTQAGPVFD
ncbi:MAG: hypothetical protein Ct9H300mP7_2050 [Verrucomicrobiota bacterium]|nr:MAG: hypothetical protein Ct9H300mP7_2050 [Verrucomicrobiota bacterium]